jgi:hypothetical protein
MLAQYLSAKDLSISCLSVKFNRPNDVEPFFLLPAVRIPRKHSSVTADGESGKRQWLLSVVSVRKLFFSCSLTTRQNKLECLLLEAF